NGIGTSLTVNYTTLAPGSVTQGPVPIKVNNSDSSTVTCAACEFINGLDVHNLVPSTVLSGTTTQAIPVDRGSFSAPTVTLVPDPQIPGQDPITTTVDTGSSSSSHVAFSANLALAAPGTYDVDVANGGGGLQGRCALCLTITSDAPTLTAMSA